MRKILSLVLCLAMLLTLAAPAFAAETAKSEDIVILYTNDVHTYIDGDMSYDTVAALKDELLNEYQHVLLVDAGDHIQGTAYGSMDKGKTIIDLMNAADYDAATLGNHEFDYGMDGTMNVISWAEYPYLSANFYHEANGVKGESVLDAYKIFDCGAEKIAIVGVTTPESFTKSTPAYFQDENGNYIYGISGGTDGSALAADVQAAIDAAKADGATKVIGLGHLGVDSSSSPWTSAETIAKVSGLDAFIDGHSHSDVASETVADKDGKNVILTQTGEYLGAIGKMVIDAETGAITTELVTGLTASDAEVAAIKDAWIAEIDTQLGTKIGQTTLTLDNYDADGNRLVRKQETNTGDFCADALYYLFDNMDMDVDVAIMNGGGVRSKAITGDLTYKTAKTIHTFGNVACLQTITGQQLLDALEWGARDVGTAECGGFLQVAGITYDINTAIAASVQMDEKGVWTGGPTDGYRVSNVQVYNKETNAYEPLDLNAKYNLAGYNYTLRDLGDGFAMFEGAVNVLDYVMEDYMVLANYIKGYENGNVAAANSPLLSKYAGMKLDYGTTAGSGRITIKDEVPGGPVVVCDVTNQAVEADIPYVFETTAETAGTYSISVSGTPGCAFKTYIGADDGGSGMNNPDWDPLLDYEVAAGQSFKVEVFGYDWNMWTSVAGTINLTVTFTEGTGSGSEEKVEYEFGVYDESNPLVPGTYELTLVENAENTLFAFTPDEIGIYTFTVSEGATIGYWGAGSFLVINPNSTATSIQQEISDVGQSAIIGVASANSNITLTIEKTGESGGSGEVEYKDYENVHTPVAQVIPEGLVDVDITKEYFVTMGMDGYYHINGRMGPILYVDLINSEYDLTDAYGEYGALTMRGEYNGEYLDFKNAMNAYADVIKNTNGLYPVTADLHAFLVGYGNGAGAWYEPNLSCFAEIQAGTANPDSAWMVMCSYVPEKVGTEQNPDVMPLGETVVTFDGTESSLYYYEYTATEDGTLTFTVTGDKWQYLYDWTPYDFDYTPDENSQSVEMKAGDKVLVGVGPFDPTSPFTFPAGSVTLKAEFAGAKPANPFTDVTENNYFYNPVLWAVENSITGGTSASTFSPTNPCTREQVIAFLWQANGKPTPTVTENPFQDVGSNAYYYNAVLWAVENGITGGTSATTFGVGNTVTRAQFVTFLWRAMGSPEVTGENPFTDVSSNDYFVSAVIWAVQNGITGGTSASTFAPKNPCTRAQVVTMLYAAYA